MYICMSGIKCLLVYVHNSCACLGRVLDDVESYIASLGLSCAANQVKLMWVTHKCTPHHTYLCTAHIPPLPLPSPLPSPSPHTQAHHTYMYMYTYMCMYTYMYMYTYTCMYTYMYMYTYMCMYVCHVCICVNMLGTYCMYILPSSNVAVHTNAAVYSSICTCCSIVHVLGGLSLLIHLSAAIAKVMPVFAFRWSASC